MINVKIKFISLLADYTDEKELIVSTSEKSSIKDVIQKLVLKYGENFKKVILNSQDLLNKYIILGLNGEDIRNFQGLDTSLQAGDEIAFLPAIAGG